MDDGEHRDDRDTTGRLLALLSLLQGRPRWSGPELADRLGVTVRTVRRDIDRLRRLGYPVHTEVGVTGGYALGSGGRAMPPLMLDRAADGAIELTDGDQTVPIPASAVEAPIIFKK